MKCPHCGGKTQLYRQINQNGAKVVVERCEACRRNPNKGKPFLPKNTVKDWDALPLFEDNSLSAEPCVVRGCRNRGSEYNHWAPRHLFEDCEDWPGGWLCLPHHTEWHKKTRTGSYYVR